MSLSEFVSIVVNRSEHDRSRIGGLNWSWMSVVCHLIMGRVAVGESKCGTDVGVSVDGNYAGVRDADGERDR